MFSGTKYGFRRSDLIAYIGAEEVEHYDLEGLVRAVTYEECGNLFWEPRVIEDGNVLMNLVDAYDLRLRDEEEEEGTGR